MTIALGALIPDRGVVMATDSMRADYSRPWPRIQLDGEKFVWLGRGRIAMVASGTFVGFEPRPIVTDGEWTVDELAPQVYSALSMLASPHHRDGVIRPPHLLMGGSPQDQVPQLRLLSANRPKVEGIQVAGCMSDWADARGLHGAPTPATLEATVELAIESCRAFILESYREWGIEGWHYESKPGAPIPPMAFPIHVAVMTPSTVTRKEISE